MTTVNYYKLIERRPLADAHQAMRHCKGGQQPCKPSLRKGSMMRLLTLNADCTVEDILAAMHRDGGCIVSNLLTPETLQRLESDLNPWIERTPMGLDEFGGRVTKRTGALVARCPSVRPVVMDQLVLAAANAFLAPYCERIQLNNTQLITLLPGQGSQPLHRDRLTWGGSGGGYIPKPIEPQFNTMWALTDFTTENGATVIAPGSQNWDLDRRAKPEEITQAEMPRGSVLLYSGSVIHGGGRNHSTARRIGMNITYNLSWLRQEENQYLSCPADIAKQFESELTDLLGYTMANYALGFCSMPETAGEISDVLPPEVALGRAPTDHAAAVAESNAAAPQHA